MAFSTLTRYLRLKIRTDLSLQASQNIARLDALGNSFAVGETDDLELRSRGNIVLKPEASEVGGSSSGGEVHVGTSAQPVAVKFFATSFEVAGGAGSLLTESSLNTLTNKSISGASNLLSNISYSSLLLSNSIKNSDIASDAAIADSKLATISTAGKVNVSALTGSLSGSLLPSYTGNSEKYLRLNSDGSALEWSSVAAGGVTSVNGQSGDVTLSIPTQYTDAMADSRVSAGITALKGEVNGLASLDSNGKLPTSQLPSLAITSTSVVASEAAMLALSAQEGDVAIRTDNGKTYLLAGDPTVVGDWKEIVAGGAVVSVNGQTGTVSLSTTNVSEGSNQYFTDARAKSASVVHSMAGSQLDQAPSVSSIKSYVNDKVAKVTWSGTNSVVLNTGWGNTDVIFYVFERVTNEQIIPESITWDANYNNATLSLPSGVVAGNWRVLAYKMFS
jgi:hypothetical protein